LSTNVALRRVRADDAVAVRVGAVPVLHEVDLREGRRTAVGIAEFLADTGKGLLLEVQPLRGNERAGGPECENKPECEPENAAVVRLASHGQVPSGKVVQDEVVSDLFA
jgi:hypothetical protein